MMGIPDGDVFISNNYGSCLARRAIDQILGPEMIRPGACVELTDGLWGPASLSSALPLDWSGTCDFSCCTSEFLAEELKAVRPAAVFRSDSRKLSFPRVLETLQDAFRRLRCASGDRGDVNEAYMKALNLSDRTQW